MTGYEDLDATYEPPSQPARAASSSRRFVAPALTILAHPDPPRVGESAHLPRLLGGDRVELSRVTPAFARPRGAARPLADRALSRKATWLASSPDGGVEVAPWGAGALMTIDDARVIGPLQITRAQLARGVVMTLADRIALLLHLSDTPSHDPAPPFGMIGDSPTLERARDQIRAVAPASVPVLLRGETGTGKELAARALHEASERRRGPFVAVNMGALAPALAPSELFGHVRGAFSGAVGGRDGHFAQADRGTLFLDEIGEAPTEVQVMLLRALESGEVQAVGATTPRRLDVRLVAATDAPLEEAVASGAFKAALYHRLAGYEISLPPLRDRPQDIGALLYHFLAQELAAFGAASRLAAPDPGEPPWLPPSLVGRLVRLRWPGNVRQLKNVARQLAVSGYAHAQVALDPALQRLMSSVAPGEPSLDAEAPAPGRPAPQLTETGVLAALEAHDFRLAQAAKALGIARNTLNAFIDRSPGLRRPRDLGPDEILAALAHARWDTRAAARALRVSERGLKLRQREVGAEWPAD